jgi:hypothetical protein
MARVRVDGEGDGLELTLDVMTRRNELQHRDSVTPWFCYTVVLLRNINSKSSPSLQAVCFL